MKQFFLRSKWTGFDKLGAVLAAGLVAYLVLPSSLFLKPLSLSVQIGDPKPMVTMVREVPFGGVTARWQTEVRGELYQCNTPGGVTPYENIGLRPVSYPLAASLIPCAQQGGEFFKVQTHWVYLLGILPLRPVQTTWRCPEGGGACVKV